MPLTNTPLDKLLEADLRALIDGNEVERRALDFKLTLPPRATPVSSTSTSDFFSPYLFLRPGIDDSR